MPLLRSLLPAASPLDELVAIMERLRDPERGCEWDIAQTFETIAPYTVEEAYEVADACARGDMESLKDELGDLQLQIVYHSRMAEERGAFALDDVIRAICDKMIRRHPHIFAGQSERPDWEALKAAERAEADHKSVLDGVARALPALSRAAKIQNRAARQGFDWPDAAGPRAKIDEELAEMDAAESQAEREAEIGDLLFSAVNLARHLDIDPEAALAAATQRFEARYRFIEQLAEKPLLELSLDEYESLWRQAKARLAVGG
jgi:ATP diphosphatase